VSESTTPLPLEIHPFRAWGYLVWFSFRRQARVRQMVWIAFGLLALAVIIVGLNTAAGRWSMANWRVFGRNGPSFDDWLVEQQTSMHTTPAAPETLAVNDAIFAAVRAVIGESDFLTFTRGFVVLIFVSFLLPMWSMSFATESLGGERESQSMIWLMTRPLPRWSIYLAKFIAMLPWALTLNVGGFALCCWAGGRPGPIALGLFWPAVLAASLAFCSLYFLIGAFFRWPAIVAIVYSFFFEVLIGNMPGILKRVSISFYARCMMFEAAETRGYQPENPVVYDPVSGTTGLWVLLGLTVFLLLLGMVLFERTQHDTTA